MTRAEALKALPPDANVPARWVQELLEEQRHERISEAVVREETIALYCELATRHLCVSTSE